MTEEQLLRKIANVIEVHLKDPRRPGGKGAMVLAGDIVTEIDMWGFQITEKPGAARLCTQCRVAVYTNDGGETWWDSATGLTACPHGPLTMHVTDRS